MCDYSLEHIKSRDARVGDKLVTTRFNKSWTRGFAAIDDPAVAVCLLPGTELVFESESRRALDHLLAFFRGRYIGSRVARFRQVDPGKQHVHHDALEFSNGKTVLLTELMEGQCATVLQLPVTADHADVRRERRMASTG
jgi:hypothetical protein